MGNPQQDEGAHYQHWIQIERMGLALMKQIDLLLQVQDSRLYGDSTTELPY
jgi:hypothetical protein